MAYSVWRIATSGQASLYWVFTQRAFTIDFKKKIWNCSDALDYTGPRDSLRMPLAARTGRHYNSKRLS